MGGTSLVADRVRIRMGSVNYNSVDMFSEAYSMVDFIRGLLCVRERSASVDTCTGS